MPGERGDRDVPPEGDKPGATRTDFAGRIRHLEGFEVGLGGDAQPPTPETMEGRRDACTISKRCRIFRKERRSRKNAGGWKP